MIIKTFLSSTDPQEIKRMGAVLMKKMKEFQETYCPVLKSYLPRCQDFIGDLERHYLPFKTTHRHHLLTFQSFYSKDLGGELLSQGETTVCPELQPKHSYYLTNHSSVTSVEKAEQLKPLKNNV